MFATAAEIPEELFERILDFAVGDVGMTKRELGMCALTCTYWAEKVQPRIFDHITLRSAEDVRTLLSFFASEYSRVVEYLDFLILEQNGPSKPWFHLVSTLLMPRPLGLTITMTIVDFHSQKATWPVRSIHGALPRVTPAFSYNIRELTLADIHFRSFSDFMHLLSEVSELGTLTCRNLTWPELILAAEAEQGMVRLPPLRRLPRSLSTVTFLGCSELWSPIWLFVGRNRLIPHAVDPKMDINVNTVDALAIYDIIHLFIGTLDPKVSSETEHRIMFHRSGDAYYLQVCELTDDEDTSAASDTCHLPDITFTLKLPTRETRLPFAAPLSPELAVVHFVTTIEFDFRTHPFEYFQLPLFDWAVFDAMSASLPRLRKVSFGLREKADAQRFFEGDSDASTPDSTPDSDTTLEPEAEFRLGTLVAQLRQANKARCAYWDAQKDEWVLVPDPLLAQESTKPGRSFLSDLA